MIYLIKIFLIFVSFNIQAENYKNNKVIFKINNNGFTEVDLERRIKYLEFNNNTNYNQLDEKTLNEIRNDYIGALIFNEYFKKNNFNFKNIENEINNFYDYIYSKNNLKNKKSQKEINIIKNNIKLDLIRKKIIENFLNNKKSLISIKNNEHELLYNYTLHYIIIDKRKINLDSYEKINEKSEFEVLRKKLIDDKIEFFEKKEEIANKKFISKNIKNLIDENKRISILIDKNYATLISIEKNLTSYKGIYVKLINFNSKEKIAKSNLTCEKIKNNNNKIEFKEYEYDKLNNKIKKNLKSVGDYILLKNENGHNYILLCDLRYDKKLLNTLNFNKSVSNAAKNLQIKFINKYKKEYNFMTK